MSATAMYITLLVVSVGLTFLVGSLLVKAGQPFLQEVFQDEKVTRSVNLLLSVLFHLITLGVLSMVSVLELGNAEERPLQAFVMRLGIVLLLLGVAYGVSMLVLIRVRERRRAAQIHEQVEEKLAERAMPPVAAPMPPAASPAPELAPPPTRPVAPKRI